MAQPQDQENQNPTFLMDILYCSEEGEEVGEQDDDEESSFYPLSVKQSLTLEEEELAFLFSKEQDETDLRIPYSFWETNPPLALARSQAVEWILEVHAYYSFSALTALLAVNYLDRFLFCFNFHGEKPWTTQLAAVACLSLAAKMEETEVPLLLDLQVEKITGYVFEAKTIQKMEILVLSTLQWKMNPLTPLSVLDYVSRRLGLKNADLRREFLRMCELLLLSVLSDCRFAGYLPSAMAAAAMLHVFSSVDPRIVFQYRDQLLGILRFHDEGRLENCCELFREVPPSRILASRSNKRKFRQFPGSPNGVMDLSFGSDCSNDSWAAASVSSSPEKKKAEEPFGRSIPR